MRKIRPFAITGKAVVLAMIAFFLFFAATNIRSGWLYMVDAVLGSLLLYSFLVIWQSPSSLRVQRRLLHIAQQGEDVMVTLRVENQGARALLCFKIGDVFPRKGLAPEEAQVVENERFFLRLGPGEAGDFAYVLPCRRRGRYAFAAYRVTFYGPLGLFSRTRELPLPSELLVYPQLPDLEGAGISGADQRQQRSGDIPQPFLIGRSGMLPKGIRDYRPGDSQRLIHWRSSARMARLMVKDLEVETGLAFNLFLDAGTPPPGDEEGFEQALRLAGAVAMYGLRHGHVCQILTPRREPVVSAPRLLDFLARMEPDSPAPLAARLAEVADALGPRATAILALQRLDAAAAAACVRLQGSGVSLVVYVGGVTDPGAAEECERHGIPLQTAAKLFLARGGR